MTRFRGLGVACVAIVALILLGAWLDWPPAVRGVVYTAGTSLGPVGLFLGIRENRPTARLAWLLVAVGTVVSGLGDVLFMINPYVRLIDLDLIWVNVPYLLKLPLIAAGMIILVRRRTPGWDGPTMIDAAIVAVSASLVSWVFVIKPVSVSTTGTLLTLMTVAFPVGDLLLMVIGVRLMLGGGLDLPALRLFSVYLVVFCGTDTWYTVMLLDGHWEFSVGQQIAWGVASMALGQAARHPSMVTLGDRTALAAPTSSLSRLGVLAATSLLAPLTLVIQYLRGDDLHVLLVAGCCSALFLLVVARLAAMVQVQRHAAITDALTGLHTRRYFAEVLTTECARVSRNHESLALIILDVDHFKKVNDTYGHTAGDRVLVEIARRLREGVRTGDVVARYGGEEFAVLLPRTTTSDAAVVAERLREAVAGQAVLTAPTEVVPVTISLGVAALPDHAGSPDELVSTADRLLYDSKQGGRNRVTILSATP